MEIVFGVIVAIIVLAVVYVCALSFGKRQGRLDANQGKRRLGGLTLAPNTKEHGIDLQARRKLYDDAT